MVRAASAPPSPPAAGAGSPAAGRTSGRSHRSARRRRRGTGWSAGPRGRRAARPRAGSRTSSTNWSSTKWLLGPDRAEPQPGQREREPRQLAPASGRRLPTAPGRPGRPPRPAPARPASTPYRSAANSRAAGRRPRRRRVWTVRAAGPAGTGSAPAPAGRSLSIGRAVRPVAVQRDQRHPAVDRGAGEGRPDRVGGGDGDARGHLQLGLVVEVRQHDGRRGQVDLGRAAARGAPAPPRSAGSSGLSNTRGPECGPAERTSISTRISFLVGTPAAAAGRSGPELVRAAVVVAARAGTGVRRRRVVEPGRAEAVRVQLPGRGGVGRVDRGRAGQQVEVLAGGTGEARVALQAMGFLARVRRPERGQCAVAGLPPDELDRARGQVDQVVVDRGAADGQRVDPDVRRVRGELMPLSALTLFATVQPEEPVVPSRLIPAVTFRRPCCRRSPSSARPGRRSRGRRWCRRRSRRPCCSGWWSG